MSVTATELKNNLGKYLLLSATEDILLPKMESSGKTDQSIREQGADGAVSVWNSSQRCRY